MCFLYLTKPKLLSPTLKQNLDDIITCSLYWIGIHYVKVHVIQRQMMRVFAVEYLLQKENANNHTKGT
jgi:hypothetical protein